VSGVWTIYRRELAGLFIRGVRLVSGVWTICRRELAGLFIGPLAWVLLFVALLVKGFFLTLYLGSSGGEVNGALALTFGASTLYWVLMVLLPPLLTMRMVSEEASSGVLEFVLTAPVTDAAVIVGKLLAATTFMALLWSTTLIYGAALHLIGAPPDWGILIAGFVGSVLASALFCAMGLMASALTATPLIAAFLAVIFNVVLLFAVPIGGAYAGELLQLPPGHWIGDLFRQVNVLGHLRGSTWIGVIDSAHVVFFLAWTALFTFLAVRLVETRRWR